MNKNQILLHVFPVYNLCEIFRVTQWCFELNIKIYTPYRPVIFLMSQWLKKVRLLEFSKMCLSLTSTMIEYIS